MWSSRRRCVYVVFCVRRSSVFGGREGGQHRRSTASPLPAALTAFRRVVWRGRKGSCKLLTFPQQNNSRSSFFPFISKSGLRWTIIIQSVSSFLSFLYWDIPYMTSEQLGSFPHIPLGCIGNLYILNNFSPKTSVRTY